MFIAAGGRDIALLRSAMFDVTRSYKYSAPPERFSCACGLRSFILPRHAQPITSLICIVLFRIGERR